MLSIMRFVSVSRISSASSDFLRPLIEIDRYGERLFGCIECNRWKWVGSNRPVMELAPGDLGALRARVGQR